MMDDVDQWQHIVVRVGEGRFKPYRASDGSKWLYTPSRMPFGRYPKLGRFASIGVFHVEDYDTEVVLD